MDPMGYEAQLEIDVKLHKLIKLINNQQLLTRAFTVENYNVGTIGNIDGNWKLPCRMSRKTSNCVPTGGIFVHPHICHACRKCDHMEKFTLSPQSKPSKFKLAPRIP